jgi:hypothetical protein
VSRLANGQSGKPLSGAIGFNDRLDASAASAYFWTRTRIGATESGRQALSALTRFLGDTPLRVVLKLLVVSFLVGLVMNAFGWSPMDVLYGIRNFFVDLWNLGFRAIDRFLGYILLGAAIVIPAFILLRIANYRK